MTVREKLPIRRTKTTNQPSNRDWSEHKPDLKEDFNSCCGYCDSYDGFRHTYFEVDHFVPKSLFEISGNIEKAKRNALLVEREKFLDWMYRGEKNGWFDEYDAHLEWRYQFLKKSIEK